MEVARAQDQGQDEEEADARVQGQTDGAPHEGLAEGAGGGQEVAEEVELGDLGRVRQQAAEVGADGVDGDVQPAADGIVGRVLPGLQAVAMAEVVGGLPVVEGLVAVLDGREEGGDGVGGQEDVEGRDGLDGEGILHGPVFSVSVGATSNQHRLSGSRLSSSSPSSLMHPKPTQKQG